MPERTVSADGIEFWTEGFGDPANPTVLLIMGAMAQGIIWPVPLVDRIVGTGKHVIRYDHRDVGQSSSVDYRTAPYTVNQLADDAVAVLDGWGIEKAHVVGVSMGGMIAQLLMIHAPHRLLGSTLISTTPLAGPLFCEDLPIGPYLKAIEQTGPMETPDNKQDWLEQQVSFFSALSDPAALDTDLLRRALEEVYDRAKNIEAARNHVFAIANTQPIDRRPMLAQCTTPTTVLHGGRDPIFPLSHGQALADTIPGTQIQIFDSMAHDLPEYCWDAIVESV